MRDITHIYPTTDCGQRRKEVMRMAMMMMMTQMMMMTKMMMESGRALAEVSEDNGRMAQT